MESLIQYRGKPNSVQGCSHIRSKQVSVLFMQHYDSNKWQYVHTIHGPFQSVMCICLTWGLFMCQRNSIERGRGMETISVVIQNWWRVICIAMTFFISKPTTICIFWSWIMGFKCRKYLVWNHGVSVKLINTHSCVSSMNTHVSC